ncbi:MAG: Eco57I restriction-modification methylase domain-containing protein (plasmid) [Candidatus Methanoperedens sp.]|uniref:Eco57I restriction-modification methylase domain-containing protein n=1 Tax=Candidatus Methanoperedens sp. BLZ2 TaxID=2035255 RepID=UPI0015968D0A|nr:Eco57I restriction-modification methylase domain-containing protein [Candidatus Methanoperedens sp. BLZ2]MBZ0175640.1 Eco57I restriction-modification methylase domain-containing protein [Candidatus Methanoperedens nitroreducens]WAH95090.1 MAG: Eco57I restriction-modification methylase domain-containing protein [Candidatus Methanoperedens sp.]WAM22188.1 MAG: Eco57I restriction-modification methylase domain-containing protein [Candidatus Methanoperedens sp.]
MTEITREDILKINNMNDVVNMFKGKGFSEHKIVDNNAVMKISEEKDLLKIVLIDSLSDLQKYHSYLKYPVEYLLLITTNFENFAFLKKGFTKLDTEKFSTFKFNKSNISRTTIKKLNGLSFDKTDTFESMFVVKEVVKRFFDQFEKEHEKFSKEITGISVTETRDWYASIIINRLMFIYFLQKKKLLFNNIKKCYDEYYLRSILESAPPESIDKFYTKFLRTLFFEGFAKRYEERSHEAKDLLGDKIQYLNGGLFLKHKIEIDNPDINIKDQAFEDLFTFFDEWSWYLDDRHFDDEQQVSADEEINPDVLGYIFEKYVNQRQMGAYYTKEDITGNISKNTIIPFIFNKVQTEHPEAFTSKESRWHLLKDNPDEYFYPAMKKGIKDANGNPIVLPDNITAGIRDVSKRTDWNKPADEKYALETETWREVVARRTRYEDILDMMKKGDIKSIDDLITYNLNINKFARDYIRTINDPVILLSFYTVITKITVLDLTCGSGAFLFAGLNVLEPLYEACLDKMQSLSESSPDLCKDFVKIQNNILEHPNRRYFILKTIILNNLYGVDIMEEAVEICKLRLFLKLVANMENTNEIRPLPDIDYNIRCGNTLVGYTNKSEVDSAVRTNKIGEGKTDQLKLRKVMTRLTQYQTVFITEDIIDRMGDIEKECSAVDKAFKEFKRLQTKPDINPNMQAVAKKKLEFKLADLRNKLNRYLFAEYGLDELKKDKDLQYEEWRKTHLPFHWYTEFHEIIQSGGFDVIIGNPPYVEYNLVKTKYTVRDPQLMLGGNLHSMVTYRSLTLCHDKSYLSMIVPVALMSTDRMASIRKALNDNSNVWLSNYAIRPSKLFTGAEQRLTIFIAYRGGNEDIWTTQYIKWNSDERDYVFSGLEYSKWSKDKTLRDVWPKLGSPVAEDILRKVEKQDVSIADCLGNDTSSVLYHKNTGIGYFVVVTKKPPECFINGKKEPSSRETALRLKNPKLIAVVHCVLSSSLYFVVYQQLSNCRDLNPSDIQTFRIPASLLDEPTLERLSQDLQTGMEANSWFQVRHQQQTGEVRIQSFTPSLSKPIIDEIDRVLAQHYGFTEEELDYIINYDIKYRMGQDNENEE